MSFDLGGFLPTKNVRAINLGVFVLGAFDQNPY